VAHDPPTSQPPGNGPAAKGNGASRTAARRAAFLCVFLFVWGGGTLLFADFLWRTGLYGLKYGILALQALLFALIAFVFCTVLFGFLAIRLGRSAPEKPVGPSLATSSPLAPTAVVFPIHDEDVAGVLARVEAIWRSLQRTGLENGFHIFLLSDSLEPARWIEEEIVWFHVARRLRAVGHVHYRHRPVNTGMKAGNLTDFLEHWGRAYRYMIVLDADSLMSGGRMVELVRRMEEHPEIGILQTVPGAIRARSVYARAQQFVIRLYGPLVTAGMDFWQAGDAFYFGHNAIVRVQPFMAHCRLPRLPWREPLGGQIFSHDFVEAALMRRAGWEVRVARELDGSYEETPANMVESLRRHRRWCQGSLQHFWLLFSRELPLVSRTHFLLGILTYISSPLWLLFLIFSTLVVVQFKNAGLTFVATSGFTPLANFSLAAHGALLYGLCLLLLFTPRALSLADLLCNPMRRHLFRGGVRTTASVVLGSLFSVLEAPLFMLWHSFFVMAMLFGKGVAWGVQNRAQDQSLAWQAAARSHGWMTLIGVAWTALALAVDPHFGYSMLPVLAPLILSIPLNVFFSSVPVGDRLRRAGLLQTPEETNPPQEIRDFEAAEKRIRGRLDRINGNAFLQAIVEPYVNALHGELQRQPYATDEYRRPPVDERLVRQLLREGSGALSRAQLFDLLLDGAACRKAYLQLWRTPDAELAPEWCAAIAAYAPNRQPALLRED